MTTSLFVLVMLVLAVSLSGAGFTIPELRAERAKLIREAGPLAGKVDLTEAEAARWKEIKAQIGKFDDAIEQCKTAILVDPGFGNPYNDIGSYLIQKGELDKAIPWLEMAKKAPRYEPRHFPYLNLFRVYLSQGRLDEAQREYQQARFIQAMLEFEAGTGDAPVLPRAATVH